MDRWEKSVKMCVSGCESVLFQNPQKGNQSGHFGFEMTGIIYKSTELNH